MKIDNKNESKEICRKLGISNRPNLRAATHSYIILHIHLSLERRRAEKKLHAFMNKIHFQFSRSPPFVSNTNLFAIQKHALLIGSNLPPFFVTLAMPNLQSQIVRYNLFIEFKLNLRAGNATITWECDTVNRINRLIRDIVIRCV